MSEQLLLPIKIEMPEHKKEIIPLEVWPVELPRLEPTAQLNLLAKKVGLLGSAGIWREYFMKRDVSLIGFFHAIEGHTERPEILIPEIPYEPGPIIAGIKKLFRLNTFPIGNPQTWRCMITGKPYLKRAMTTEESGNHAGPRPAPTPEKPRRQMPEHKKVILRKRNAMKRVLKTWGLFAPGQIKDEYRRKGWVDWDESDDKLWAEELKKWNTVKKKR